MSLYLALFLNALICVLAFYKSSAKDMSIPILKDFTPWHWWLTFSLFTNTVGLQAWWKISSPIEDGGFGMLKAVVITSVIALVIDVILLSIHYKIEFKYIVALALVGVAGYIIK
jgi:hypothetical protein